jgi:hypothetical protein
MVAGPDVTVAFEVTDFRLVPSGVPLAEMGRHPEANRPGEGHLHFMLDLQPLVVHERAEPYTFRDVAAGEHRLVVELVNNDHSSLDPPLVRQVRFRVEPAASDASQPERLPNAGAAALASGLMLQALGIGALALIVGGWLLRSRVGRRSVS